MMTSDTRIARHGDVRLIFISAIQQNVAPKSKRN